MVKYCAYPFTNTALTAAAGKPSPATNEYYPRALGMLPLVQKAGGAFDPRASTDLLRTNKVVASNCVWATTTGVKTAGPKNGATNLAASLTALALGAAILAF